MPYSLLSRFMFNKNYNAQEAEMNYDLSGFSKTGNHHPAQCGFTLVLIAIKDYFILNEMYGQGFIQQLEHELKEAIASTAHENNDCRHMEAISVGPGQVSFIVPRTNAPADIAYEYKLKAQNGLKRTMFNHTGIGIDLGMGFATLEVGSSMPDATGSLGDGDDPIRFESALDEARRILRTPLDMQGLSIANTYNDILAKSLISTHYQPILDFKSGSILGWEALSRGPEGSSFRSPVILFETAEQFGRLFALERLCRESAIRNAGPLRKGQKLFLNIHPKTMADPEFTPGKTLELMEQAGLVPDDIVFEITERHSVQDFDLFYRTLDHYRSQGFCVAVDDAGAGYAGLTLIAQLQPEYIKLDKLLIDKIHKDPVKRALVETTVTFADKIGSRIIAEGIETKAQTLCLKDIGVHCGQGYFLARPAFPKPELTKECLDIQSVSDISARNITCSLPIGDLAHPPHSVPADYLVADAQEFFKNNSRFSSIIVTDDDIPRGLVMEYHLNRQLSSQYGIALYYRRPIEAVMDATPLTVELDTPVEQAARQAMKREHLKAYDDIIITRKGRLYGIVSVQNLLNAMAKIQVEMAKGTNPLTGLPGNVAIEKEVESRIAQKRKFSIIYADLDNFKVYNDTYGFKNGDGVLKLAADIMSWAARKHAGQEAQVCHIGGDDFVLITAPEPVEKICRSIHRCFGRLINRCYCPEDRARGWIKARGRDGQERNYPLVSISLGVIEICGQCSLMEIGERAAHVKKFAKSRPGNSVAMDRRPPLGSEEAKR
ncbi:diguanylate cyclase [Pseudodesulfovibrio aespoeensis Aspo-2]|uniref:Diguanylate cyclase n=1 Tax=Pseudodesulfovibrio aespoeensis (strain ATCC 700646 / DSM 10631 / Aspo-2) TaxID=643562 RepID=E6VW19_PSEA9|nr:MULTISPECIES: GGDEF domain-containing protein [Pseudodesulfovibrio]ADU62464.1 diguanylate cyclase [Pseudodesulfovibrio aespoeensis Aspo-2]